MRGISTTTREGTDLRRRPNIVRLREGRRAARDGCAVEDLGAPSKILRRRRQGGVGQGAVEPHQGFGFRVHLFSRGAPEFAVTTVTTKFRKNFARNFKSNFEFKFF